MKSTILICMFIFLGLVIIGGLTYLYIDKKKSSSSIPQINKVSTNRNTFVFYMQRLYKTLPFTKKLYMKTLKRIQALYPADELSISKKATSYLTTAFGISIAVSLLAILSAKGDVFYILCGLLVGYLIIELIVNIRLENLENKLLTEFKDFLDNVLHQYNMCHIVTDAIYDTLNTSSFLVSLHTQRIHSIITSQNIDFETNRYRKMSPNRFLLMFLAICSSITKSGDTGFRNKSISDFTKSVNNLKEGLNEEILKRNSLQNAIRLAPFMTLLPLVFIKPIEAWAKSNFDGIETYFEGAYGIIATVILFLVCVGSHYYIRQLKDGKKVEERESSIWYKLSKIKYVDEYLNKYINHNKSRAERINKKLKAVGCNIGPKAFMMKRITYGLLAFICTLIVLCSAFIRERIQTTADFAANFENSIVISEDYRKMMEVVAEDYSQMYTGTEYRDVETMKEIIKENTQIKSDSAAEEVATAIVTALDKKDSIYFQWYYILIAYAVAVAAFFIPTFMVRIKEKLVDMDKEDEINQFRIIMSILINIDGVTINTILEWMQNFSSSYRITISHCILNMEYDEEKALKDMQRAEKNDIAFCNFVDNIIAVRKVSVKKAFATIETDKEYYKDKRRQDNEIMNRKKAEKANMISMIPLFTVIIIHLIGPILLMSLEMFSTLQNVL